MDLISILIPTYNEEENISELILEVIKNLDLKIYDYEIIVIDNNSSDNTVGIVKKLILTNKKIKLIVNNRNYGHIRSPVYGLMQTKGDASILMNADFQDPPELINKLISMWKDGADAVLLKKEKSKENKLIFYLRSFFYHFLNKISDINLPSNTTGSGIFDKKLINNLKKINDPYPYFRGLIYEIAGNIKFLNFEQPVRRHGKTKNNFYTLYDLAMLGVIKHSKIPIRFLSIFGFILSLISVISAFFYFFMKLIFWEEFQIGIAPIVIGIFIFGAFQIFFLGIVGEYILSINTQSRNLPLVIEKERVNFD